MPTQDAKEESKGDREGAMRHRIPSGRGNRVRPREKEWAAGTREGSRRAREGETPS